MMKKLFTLTLGLALSCGLMAQSESTSSKKLHNPNAGKSAVYSKKTLTGFEKNNNKNNNAVPESAWARGLAKPIGSTEYDLQTNGSQKPRLINYGNGEISAAFTMGTGDFVNRGTGYNRKAAGANTVFGTAPTKRVETVRTGFTNLLADVDGTEYAFAHTSVATGFQMVMSKKAKGATTWTQSLIPTSATGGSLWAHVGIGGANGKTIHMVSASGEPHKGLDLAMIYHRSKDGGATWDKKDVILPGADSTRYVGFDGDNYVVATKGDKIAIAHFASWSDTEVWISNDNGDNWTRKTAYDFPLDLYKTDDGYDASTLPDDPGAPAPEAILSTDNDGTVFFDKSGNVHIVAGRMYIADTDLGDGNTSYYPGTYGFHHWAENYPKDSIQFIDAWPNLIKNDSLDVENLVTYFHSMTCHPSSAVGSDGTIYVAYSAVSEGLLNGNDDNLRRIYIIHSKDNGKTWSEPFAVNSPKYFSKDDFETEFAECVFPTLATKVDATKLHLLYHLDYTPGLLLQNIQTDAEEVSAVYVDIDISDFLTKTQDVIAAETVKFQLSPNPSNGTTTISYVLAKEGQVTITMTDMLGKTIQKNNLGKQNAGQQTYFYNTTVPAGVYLVQLNIDGQIATKKLVVR